MASRSKVKSVRFIVGIVSGTVYVDEGKPKWRLLMRVGKMGASSRVKDRWPVSSPHAMLHSWFVHRVYGGEG